MNTSFPILTAPQVPVAQQAISITAPQSLNGSRALGRWARVSNTRSLVNIINQPAPQRAQGVMEVHACLILGNHGAGKSWLVAQAARHLAARGRSQKLASADNVVTTAPSDSADTDPSAARLPGSQTNVAIDTASVIASAAPPAAAPAPALAPAEEQATARVIAATIVPATESDRAAGLAEPPAPAPATSSMADAPSVLSDVYSQDATLGLQAPETSPSQDSAQLGQRMHTTGRSIPLIIKVAQLSDKMTASLDDHPTGMAEGSLLKQYLDEEYPGDVYAKTRDLLVQAFALRELLILVDGLDEAAGLQEQVEAWVWRDLLPSGNQLLVTCRPNGALIARYAERFVLLELQPVTEEQKWQVLADQVKDNAIFARLQSICTIQLRHDAVYELHFPAQELRDRIESLGVADSFMLPDGRANPELRLKGLSGTKLIDLHRGSPRSVYLRQLSQFLTPRLRKNVEEDIKPVAGRQLQQQTQQNASPTRRHTTIVHDLDILLDRQVEKQLHEDVAMHEIKDAVMIIRSRETKVGELSSQQQVAVNLGTLAFKLRKTDKAICATTLWARIVRYTDELYVVAERHKKTFQEVITSLGKSAGMDVDKPGRLKFGGLRDPVLTYELCMNQYQNLFDDGSLPAACVKDSLTASFSCNDSTVMVALCEKLVRGYQTEVDASGDSRSQLKALKLANTFDNLSTTHFRSFTLIAKLTTSSGTFILVQVEVQHAAITACNDKCNALESLQFFREKAAKSLATRTQPPTLAADAATAQNAALLSSQQSSKPSEGTLLDVDKEVELALAFLTDAVKVPLLFSFLILLWARTKGVDLDKYQSLPKSELELYEMVASASVCMRASLSAPRESIALAERLVRIIATTNQLERRHVFTGTDAENVLNHMAAAKQLWLGLSKRGRRIPLITQLAAKTALGPSQYQFEHISIQEALYASELLKNADSWQEWVTDQSAAAF